MRARIKSVAPVVAIGILCAIAAIVVGWRLAGAKEGETALGRVSAEVTPSLHGGVWGYVPVVDWGIKADGAFSSPLSLQVELRSIDRPSVLRLARGERELVGEAEQDLGDVARATVLRAVLVGFAVALFGAAVAALAWRRRWRSMLLAGPLAYTLICAGLLAWTVAGYDRGAFASPTYFARGNELPRLLSAYEGARIDSPYGSTLGDVLVSFSALLTRQATAPQSPGRDVFLASDLHANPLVISPVSEFVGGNPLLLAGDFGQRGGDFETGFVAHRVAALSNQAIAVSGNHDSQRLMNAIQSDGVEVLGEGRTSSRVEGLRVAGWPDPLESPGNENSADRPITFDDLPDGAFDESAADFISWFDGLERRPDIVIVHQVALAQELARHVFDQGDERPLTIVAGHDHRQHVDRYGPVTVVDGGTVGANGLFGAGSDFSGLAELHFARSEPRLDSVDLIAIEPVSGQAQASRVVIDSMCPGQDECSFEPPNPSGTSEP